MPGPDPATDPHAAAPMGPATEVRVGDSVGAYTVVEVHARAATSSLFVARDPITGKLQRLKQVHLSGTMDDDALRSRVAQAVRRYKPITQRSPEHLTRLVDLVHDPRGVFVVSEWVTGRAIADHLAELEQGLDPRRAAGLIAGVALGLRDLHGAGLAHRCLTPGNVLLPQSGGLKLSDAGLAPAIDPGWALRPQAVPYTAPEICRGEAETTGAPAADTAIPDPAQSPSADLYAMGMIAYRLLAGPEAFEAAFKSVVRDERNAAIRWMKWHTNPRLTAPPLHTINPRVPEPLSEVVARLIAKAPAARFASVDQFLEALRRALAAADTAAAAPASSPATPTRPPDTAAAQGPQAAPHARAADQDTAALPRPGRTPLVLTALLTVWVLVALGITGYLYQQRRQRADTKTAEATATLREARDAFRDRDYADARGRYDSVAEAFGPGTRLGRFARGGALLTQGEIAMDERRYLDARQAFVALSDLNVMPPLRDAERVRRAERAAAFEAGMDEIGSLLASGQVDEARQRVRAWTAYTLGEDGAVGGDTDADALAAATPEAERLAQYHFRITQRERQAAQRRTLARAEERIDAGRYREAVELLEPILAGATDPAVRETHQRARALAEYQEARRQGETAELERNLGAAVAAYTRAMQARASAGLDPDLAPDLTDRLNALRSRRELQRGREHFEAGRMAEAIAAFEQSLRYAPSDEAREALTRIDDYRSQQGYLDAGDRAMDRGDYAAARQHYQRALELGDRREARVKLNRAAVLALLDEAEDDARAGRYDAALNAVADADRLDPDNPRVRQARDRLRQWRDYSANLATGDRAAAEGRFGEAKAAYHDARRVMDTEEVRQRLDDAEYEHQLAQARWYIDADRPLAALACARNALSLRDSEEARRLVESIAATLPGR